MSDRRMNIYVGCWTFILILLGLFLFVDGGILTGRLSSACIGLILLVLAGLMIAFARSY